MVHHQNYKALLETLQNAVRDSGATRDSPVLRSLPRDLCQENSAQEARPFVQRHQGFYQPDSPSLGQVPYVNIRLLLESMFKPR